MGCAAAGFRLLLVMAGLAPAWAQAQSLEGVLMPGPVVAGHAKLEQDCRKCHVPFKKDAQPALCLDCHKETAADIRQHKRFHGGLANTTCRNCHTEHKGRKARVTEVEPGTFSHDKTAYPLKGAHKKAEAKCASCHLPKVKYRDAPHACNACHAKDDVHKGKLGVKCEQCHSEIEWKKSSFDHNLTRFKLEFGHAGVECKACHADRSYTNAPTECVACHKKDDDKKGHKGRFGAKCASCHNVKKWKDVDFDHARDAKFALRGKHFSIKCEACHVAPLYTVKTPATCVACHRKDDNAKGHKGSLGDRCENCHNERSWRGAKFDHDKETDFPLRGKHRDARCETCHKAGVTAAPGKAREKLPTKCWGCHQQDDRQKGHQAKFGEKCEACHTEKSWKDIVFDHDRDTKYRLLGKHRPAKCASCHTGWLYRDKLAADCVACHRKDDQERGHRGKLGDRCDACHSVNGWKVETFDHNRSRFPLTGSHVRVECGKCHRSKDFKDAPRACDGCHLADDVHKRRLGTDCESCHNTRSWKSWDFDHAKTGFVLDGAHRVAQCYACHAAPMQKRISTNVVRSCFTCHVKADVHHGTFGTGCERCHSTSAWLPATAR